MRSVLTQTVRYGAKALLIAGLATCATLGVPTDRAAAQTERGVPYLTVRDRISDDEGYYGDERSTLKGGKCIIDPVSLDFLSGAAELAPFRVPEEILRVGGIKELPVEEVFEDLQTETPLLYVHGYYVGFDKGCRRATAYMENVDVEDRFLWFTWPSEDSLISYARDEINLYWSVPELAGVIADLHDRFGPGTVDLTGHSLGGRGLTLALYEIAGTRPDLRFDHVVLLAADMDFGIFQKMLPRIRPLARSMTIYTSSGDKALDISEQLHSYPRLGQSGNPVENLEGVEVIDVSDQPMMSANGHLYHINNSEVGADLSRLVNDNMLAGQRPGLEQMGPNLWSLKPKR